jgi:hypothetical protein
MVAPFVFWARQEGAREVTQICAESIVGVAVWSIALFVWSLTRSGREDLSAVTAFMVDDTADVLVAATRQMTQSHLNGVFTMEPADRSRCHWGCAWCTDP